ncbi:glycosyltransferase family 2 protein [Rhizorhabdus argentea]|uniref:glycosyltransferase family 2 protein n=1 Tax=Rhizorhabdus argentea TaxID=1387174 RepID=UPI0030EDF154
MPSLTTTTEKSRRAKVFVIVASKGRPREVCILRDLLRAQRDLIGRLIVVGSEAGDIEDVANGDTDWMRCLLAREAGAAIQRNEGIAYVMNHEQPDLAQDIIVFFDDDFRPAGDWLERAVGVLSHRPDVSALTGHILGDGVNGEAIDELYARKLLAGDAPPMAHWAAGEEREVGSVYGCNMAFRASVLSDIRFDENLPLYSWQEDLDITSRVAKLGKVLYTPECQGVHLGVKSGRTSGFRFGYSQIANPIYLYKKGTCPYKRAARFTARAIVGNGVRSLLKPRLFDYRGRFRGNLLALYDGMVGRLHPRRILDL